MKIAVFYNGSLRHPFAKKQNWADFDLGIFAGKTLEDIQWARKKGLLVFPYWSPTEKNKTPREIQKRQDDIVIDTLNDGLYADWSDAPVDDINRLVEKLNRQDKRFVLNTGWGTLTRTDYGKADILLVESFIGSNREVDGKTEYFLRDEKKDIQRLESLTEAGYKVIALTYGPITDRKFAMHCHEKARKHGAEYFIYQHPPGWAAEGSGFDFFKP